MKLSEACPLLQTDPLPSPFDRFPHLVEIEPRPDSCVGLRLSGGEDRAKQIKTCASRIGKFAPEIDDSDSLLSVLAIAADAGSVSAARSLLTNSYLHLRRLDHNFLMLEFPNQEEDQQAHFLLSHLHLNAAAELVITAAKRGGLVKPQAEVLLPAAAKCYDISQKHLQIANAKM